MIFIAGETLSLLAALALVYSTFTNKKQEMMKWQALNTVFLGFSDWFLGAHSAVVTNVLTFVRNILSAKGKLSKSLTLVICALMIVVGSLFNNRGWLGVLPIVASVQFTLCIYSLKSAQHMRIALIVNLMLWAIIDFLIQAYPMFVADIVIAIVTFVNVLRFRDERGNKKRKKATK